jgi:prepilin-type N-terminal cleavage/methylation domain-containing protein
MEVRAMTRTQKYRPAFTLIELLVATGIIAMLLALVAISLPNFSDREQLTRSVDKLRAGLLTARIWAKRDQVLTGLQFFQADGVTTATGPYTSFIYVQQPLSPVSGTATQTTANAVSLSFTTATQTIQVNQDYLVIDGDVPHLITGYAGGTCTVNSAFTNYFFNAGAPFRIIRAPQPIAMQESTDLRSDLDPSVKDPSLPPIIGMTPDVILNNGLILFLPSGTIVNSPKGSLRLTLSQTFADPNSTPDTADIFLDCMSGTSRYISPN